jgi:hypothetical protein
MNVKKTHRNYELEHFEGVTPRIIRDLIIKVPQTCEDEIFNMRLLIRAKELGIDITDKSHPNPARKKLPSSKIIINICLNIKGIIDYRYSLTKLESDINKLYYAGWLNLSEDLPIRIFGKTRDECERRALLIYYYWKNIECDNIDTNIRIMGNIIKIFSQQKYTGKVNEFTLRDLNKAKDQITNKMQKDFLNLINN